MIKMDETTIDALLYEEEGVTLDFKREQYRFLGASDDEKSELLKDILAFANAWRRTDAFILIGIEEVKGGKSLVKGVKDRLDDANIQQFVNSKTQRPITFSYRTVKFEDKDVAVIQIPCQDRPFHLIRDYGKLKKNTVYIRRGSSTSEATLDEIARMGSSTPLGLSPKLEVFFSANPSSRERHKEVPIVKSLFLNKPANRSIPAYKKPHKSSHPWTSLDTLTYANSNYYRELVRYTGIHRFFGSLGIGIDNLGTATAHDVRVELLFSCKDGSVVLMDDADFPSPPEKDHMRFPNIIDTSKFRTAFKQPDVWIKKIKKEWIVNAQAEKVQPKATHWFKTPFFVGSKVSKVLDIPVIVFADNLQEPHRQQLLISFEAEERTVSLEAIIELERERYLTSPERKRSLQERGLMKNDDLF